MNYLTAARVAARSTRVSFYHALWLANEKTKVVTSQKSFSSSGSQTLFSAEPVTEKIRLRSQAKKGMATHQITSQWVSSKRAPKIYLLRFDKPLYALLEKRQIAGITLFKFLEPQTIHAENLAVSGDTSYNIGRMGRQIESSECFQIICNSFATVSERW